MIEADPLRLVSCVTRVEAAFVIVSRKGEGGRAELNRFLELLAAEVMAVTADQAEIACEAFRGFGKGRHAAELNFGDVFAYALAKATSEPLLFKGNDFNKTDIVSVAGL